MTDTKNPGEKTMGVGQGIGQGGKTLTLKRPVEQGVVRQSFSHGRSKAVVVEKVKRRVIGPGEGKPEASAPPAAAQAAPAPAASAPAAPAASAPAAPAQASAPSPAAAAPAPA
ncbi:translation initiation factor IF-2 associated domain-containing protein, partial [Ancylobacter lacus]|uniref:translation initiation factor IF-2 associated domain-containing protein n=1 Tax=Ancylobacter lacus TaxID=2579970 RepID=UPI001BD15EFA